jgi:putative DNA primase/helicase
MTSSPKNIISRDTPVETAKLFRMQRHPNMIRYQNDWLDWDGAAYQMIENETIESELLIWLEACNRRVEYEVTDTAGNTSSKFRPEPFNPKDADVAQVNKALARWYHEEQGKMKPPFFLDGGTGVHAGLDPANLISHQGGMLDITTRVNYPATPQFFTRTALPVSYDENAQCPQFRGFLAEVLDDEGLVALLQQWFGYLITTDVSIQKLLYLQGVSRSGKGTIGRVLDALVGVNNVSSHMLSDIATNFDRESMIGKSLLKVSEVHAGNKQDLEKAVSVINQITGEDRTHIQRKHKGSLDVDLRLHVVLMGNGYPDFGEHATAFGTRADVIPFRITFVGREDNTLTKRLLTELPGILNFALDGLADLRQTRKFKIVASSEDAKRQILNSGNPVRAFVADLCELGPYETDKAELFKASYRYCTDVIKAHPLSEPVFFKKLREAFPGLQNTRPTVAGERENFIAGIRLKRAGPPTTVTKTFWLDVDRIELADMLSEPLDMDAAILRDPITNEPVEVIANEFSGLND